MTVTCCSSKDCTVESRTMLCIKYLNREKKSSSEYMWVSIHSWKIFPPYFLWQESKCALLDRNWAFRIISSHHCLYFPFCCLSCKMWFPKPGASHYSSSVKFFLETHKCHINQSQHLIRKQGVKHREKKANRKEKCK